MFENNHEVTASSTCNYVCRAWKLLRCHREQDFLEELDAERHSPNIIVLGVPEDRALVVDEVEKTSDQERWEGISWVIDCDEVEKVSIHHLGRSPASGQMKGPCPIKIILKYPND